MKKYVIIGNSAAAVGCIEAIRKNDKTGKITVVSDEPFHTYSRPLISYLILGKTTEEKMKYRNDNFYTDNNVDLILGKKTIKINTDKKSITLNDNSSLSYDKLLVATGSSPFIPPMNGLDKVKYHTFFTLSDALALQKELTNKSKVLIIGAGLIGLKCAECILSKVASVSVVDLAPKVLSSILNENSSQMLKSFLEEKGIHFYLSDSVKEFSENKAYLNSGEEIDFDILVMAVGVRANTSLVKDAGGAVEKGIVIDSECRTSLSDIYAAGDCTQSNDVSDDKSKVIAILPNAYMQGECAGNNMASNKTEYNKSTPMNSIGFFGRHIMSAGDYIGDCMEISKDGSYKAFYCKDNKLNGYIIIGDIAKAGIYTSLIREKTPLNTIDFNLITEKPSLMAFSYDTRCEKLGGGRK